LSTGEKYCKKIKKPGKGIKMCIGDRILMSCLIIFISAKNVFAYLDPGTGSYIVQVIIALVVGAAFSIKMFWKTIVSFFKNTFKK